MATTLQPKQTTEQLMLLKGTRDKLADIAVTPGAIYFTTDYPGIYVDFAAEGEEGSASYKEARRVRMGDVTVVETLAELKGLAVDAITAGQKLGKDTLYYAKDKNVLCIYDEDEGKFVWINDLSDLTSRVTTLEGTVGGHGTSISNISQAIGEKFSNHAATKDKTIYEAIEDEYDRAVAEESKLQEQIDAIVGESGESGSISGILDTIAELDEAYKKADEELATELNNLKGGNDYDDETVHGNAVAIGALADRLDAYDDKNIEDNAQENKIETIAVTINGTSDPSVSMGTETNAKKATITLPKDLTKYDGGNLISGINSTITNDIKGSGWGANNDTTPSLMSNLTAINTINSKLSGIENGAQVNDIETIKVTLGTPSASTGLAISGKAVTVTVPSTLAHIGAENRVAGIETNITNITKTGGAIDTAKQAAIDAAKQYTDGEIDKVEEALNVALAGADAMTFKGAIGYNDDGKTPKLPTTGVKCGDTYVISTEGSDHVYHPGDMLIALRDQAADVTSYPAGIVSAGKVIDVTDTTKGWFHVKTGYEGSHEAKISVIPDTTDGGTTTATGNKIALTSHVATTGTYGDLGTIEFTSGSSNIEITKTAGQDGAINFNLVWATF